MSSEKKASALKDSKTSPALSQGPVFDQYARENLSALGGSAEGNEIEEKEEAYQIMN